MPLWASIPSHTCCFHCIPLVRSESVIAACTQGGSVRWSPFRREKCQQIHGIIWKPHANPEAWRGMQSIKKGERTFWVEEIIYVKAAKWEGAEQLKSKGQKGKVTLEGGGWWLGGISPQRIWGVTPIEGCWGDPIAFLKEIHGNQMENVRKRQK